MISTFSETRNIIRQRLEQTSTVKEVEALQAQVRALLATFARKGLLDSAGGDDAREADRLCSQRIQELRKVELRELFK